MDIDFQAGPATDQLILRLKGDLDLYHSPQFGKLLQEKVQQGIRRFVLNLSELHYLDSSGTGVLIRALQLVKPVRGGVLVVGLSGTPKKVLEMSNIISLLRQFETEAAALAWEVAP